AIFYGVEFQPERCRMFSFALAKSPYCLESIIESCERLMTKSEYKSMPLPGVIVSNCKYVFKREIEPQQSDGVVLRIQEPVLSREEAAKRLKEVREKLSEISMG